MAMKIDTSVSEQSEMLTQILDALARVCAAGFGKVEISIRDGKPHHLQECVSRSLRTEQQTLRRVK